MSISRNIPTKWCLWQQECVYYFIAHFFPVHRATCSAHRLVHSENSLPLLSFRASPRGNMNQQLSIVSSHQHPGQNHCESSSVFVIHWLIKGVVPTPIRLGLKYEPGTFVRWWVTWGPGLMLLKILSCFLNLTDHDSRYTTSILCNLLRIPFVQEVWGLRYLEKNPLLCKEKEYYIGQRRKWNFNA